MANLDKIKPDQVLHDYHRHKVGNTRRTEEGHWLVRVIEVDLEKRRALCSWNGNPPTWWSEQRIKRLRVNVKEKPNVP